MHPISSVQHRVGLCGLVTQTPLSTEAVTQVRTDKVGAERRKEDLIRQKIRVVSLYAAKNVRLAQLARRITEESKKKQDGSRWYITDDKNAGLLVFSLRPREQPIKPTQPSQKPFPRQASHVVVSKQGSVVLVNISFQHALDILKHINDPTQGIASPLPSGKAKSAMDCKFLKKDTSAKLSNMISLLSEFIQMPRSKSTTL